MENTLASGSFELRPSQIPQALTALNLAAQECGVSAEFTTSHATVAPGLFCRMRASEVGFRVTGPRDDVACFSLLAAAVVKRFV